MRDEVTYRAFKDIQGFDIVISESRNEGSASIVLLFLDLAITSASAAYLSEDSTNVSGGSIETVSLRSITAG